MKSMVDLSHDFLKEVLHPQAICIDATLGNGKDASFFLSMNVRKIYAFEIQETILKKTVEKIADPKLEAHILSHDRMDEIVSEPVDAIVFNFGYCPNQETDICTLPETSVNAVLKALELLRPKGRMALVLYPHEQGRSESQILEEKLRALSKYEYAMIKVENFNVEACPYMIAIEKKRRRISPSE